MHTNPQVHPHGYPVRHSAVNYEVVCIRGLISPILPGLSSPVYYNQLSNLFWLFCFGLRKARIIILWDPCPY